ncbi:MAG TPA: hypothetical protein VFE60_09760 [Roseiarcus sp.]|jgi:hypothetical protein|nr:hypothetical protein [Roseiarcus sp.]
MGDYDNENWNDEYQDDIESQGMPLIRQGQSNSPKVLEGVFGIGDFLMPNGLVAKGCYQFLAIGCDDLWVHWAANRGGLLGFLPGSETPPDTAWLKPGVPRDGFPTVLKAGCYAPDGSVWERTIYLHVLVVAVGRPAIRVERPICGTFPFRSRGLKIGQNFYRSQLKTLEAVIDGKVVHNMTLGLFEMSSEIERERSYIWMAPKPTVVAVFGQPSGPSIEMARIAKNLRASFKSGGAWASEPLPAITAPPPTEAPRIPASERGTPKPDIRSGPDPSSSDPPPISPDAYDGDADSPRSLDEVIFD